MNSIPVMLHSQDFDVKLDEEDDFNIFLSVSLHHDFKTTNISRQQMLYRYIEKVYHLYEREKEVGKILELFEAQEDSLPFTDSVKNLPS